ncbi:MAG: ATP-dependent RNA helicase HrpA [Planctomycetota bacterium]|nr:MAG: ATP-dependent RNA helicase HrpA [Planctomycetota bacterium]
MTKELKPSDYEEISSLWTKLKESVSRINQIRLQVFFNKIKQQKNETKKNHLIGKFFDSLMKAHEQFNHLALHIPDVIIYADDLPVVNRKDDILSAIKKYQVVVICGDTGSGKTTQLPKMCLELGYGIKGRIGCTQPRRIAAVSVSDRVASEMKVALGNEIGYEVRFDKKTNENTYIKFMTDGILLAETQSDRNLLQYDVLIIDEAHERNLNIDFLLGYLKEIQHKRPDLKIIISSATLDAEKFADFFDDSTVIKVEGRMYPVEDYFVDDYDEDEDLEVMVEKGVSWINDVDTKGDILIFLPGEKEIRNVEKHLLGKKYSNTVILPLYAQLSVTDQQKVFKSFKQRKIILSTNVAETSLTIPGINYVIDSGLVRISRFSASSHIQKLQLEWVSQASSQQRRGRCGRISDGVCYHLYTEEIYDEMDLFTDPEIKRTSLAGVILRMKRLRLREMGEFPFIDQPNKKMILQGYRILYELGAIDKKRNVLPMGKVISGFSLDPNLARIIVEANRQNVLSEMIIIVALLSSQDPREKKRANDEEGKQLKPWIDDKSDFMTYLKLWQHLEAEKKNASSNNQFKKYLKSNKISIKRWFEWRSIVQDLKKQVKEAKFKMSSSSNDYVGLHKSLLSGLIGHIGTLDEKKQYIGSSGQHFFIFPGSTLISKKPKWLMCSSLVETTKLFARVVAEIQPEWVEDVCKHLCSNSYEEAYWNAQKGCPYGRENVKIFGLPIINKRPVFYGRIDPVESRKIFILEGLIQNRIISRLPFLKHNQSLIKSIKLLEIKSRRIDSLYFEEGLIKFYNDLIPAEIHTTKLFNKWFYKESKSVKDLLNVTYDDVFIPQITPIIDKDYPEKYLLNDISLKIKYQYKPANDFDGATILCPLHLLGQLKQRDLDWLIPGYLDEKLLELFKSLPKSFRVAMQPASNWVNRFLSFDINQSDSLLSELCRFAQAEFELLIKISDFELSKISNYLLIRIQVVDKDGRQLQSSRNLEEVQVKLKQNVSHEFEKVANIEIVIEKTDDWLKHSFEEKEIITYKKGKLEGYPGLYYNQKILIIKLFSNLSESNYYHQFGVIKLFELDHWDLVSDLYKRFPLSENELAYIAVISSISDFIQNVLVNKVIAGALYLNESNLKLVNDFVDHSTRARESLLDVADEMGASLSTAIDYYKKCTELLEECKGSAFEKSVVDVKFCLNVLWHPKFMLDYSSSFYLNLGKIMKGLFVRIERLILGPKKDTDKMERVKSFQIIFDDHFEELENKPYKSKEAISFIENLMYLRGSVFAQEIRFSEKISEKIITQSSESFLTWLKIN